MIEIVAALTKLYILNKEVREVGWELFIINARKKTTNKYKTSCKN